MKQIKIIFETKNNRLPLNYNSLMLSFLKSAVEKSDPDLYEQWFDKSRNSSSLRKSYTFSCSFPAPVGLGGERLSLFQTDGLQLGENSFSFFLSTSDLVDLMKLYNALLGEYKRGEFYPAKENAVRIARIFLSELPEIRSSSALIRFDSPVLARRHDKDANKDKFLKFHEGEFIDAIRDSTEKALEAAGLDSRRMGVERLELVPVKARSTVVQYYGFKVNGNIGVYEIRGATELLNFLLASGVGSATGSGHGKFRPVRF